MVKRTEPNDRLRRAREERNWTQADVAQAIGTSSFTVSRWELGVQAPQPHFREKLCTLFAMSPQALGLISEAPAPRPGLTAPPGNRSVRSLDAPSATLDGHASGPEEHGDHGERRARRDLLSQVRRYWIGTELEAAMDGLPRIELALTERPSAVDDPIRVLPPADQPDRHLARGTTIGDAFQRAGRQLLVLGDPGAGKTTMLLDLTRGMLQRSPDRPPGPMPVIFHLSSWSESRRPLAHWLVDELHRCYGVARRVGRAWVAGEQVVPLLDGLDEVAQQHRADCVAAINAFQRGHGQLPLVVCCRTAPYESLEIRLKLRGAIVIQPLTYAQVERYLDEAGDQVGEVQALLREDPRLLELLATPLFLSIIVRTYGGEPAARPPSRGSLPERRRGVLADYVERMLARPRAGAAAYGPCQTVRWLAWLARAMRDHGEAVFYLDWMQPSWLEARAQRRLVTLAPAVLVVLLGGLVGMLDLLLASVLLRAHTYVVNVGGGVQLSLPDQAAVGVGAGAAVGVVAGLIAALFTYERRIAPTSRLDWSWTTYRRHLPSVIAAVVGAMLISLLVDRVLSGLVVHLVYGLLLAALFKAVTGEAGAGDRMRQSWAALRHRLTARGQRAGVLAGVAVAVVAATVAAAAVSGASPETVLYRIGTRMVVGMSLGLMFGPRTPLVETVPAPGKAIETSRRNGVVAGLVSGTLAVVVFGLVDGISVGRSMGATIGLVTGLTDGLCIGVIVGVGVSLRRGTGAYARHALLRRLLVRADVAPRDYVGFLEHAAGLILLRRRGGGYEFVHRLLLDHFAGVAANPREAVADCHGDP